MRSVQEAYLTEKERCQFFFENSFSAQALLKTLETLQEAAEKHNCETVYHHLEQLKQKLIHNQRTVVFCGHFSAGKSTLLNQLIGSNLLPSHPIPTSANIVHIKKGKDATLSFRDEQSGEMKQIFTEEWGNDWFTSTDTADEVYITLPVAHFPKNLEILDTPGIDSTTAGHRTLAEERLFEADTLYYMTDYQHVESEENFTFLQELNDQYITPVLLINQIDKHDEEELSFDSYQEKIKASLSKREIDVRNVYFISARDPMYRERDWFSFTKQLFLPVNETEHVIVQTVAIGIYRELENMLHTIEKRSLPSNEIRKEMQTFASLSTLKEIRKRKESELERLSSWRSDAEKRLFQQLDTVFKNAKLVPHHTRNLARAYLEARQPSFRLKGLFRRRKTIQEKQQREDKLLESLNENVRNYIDIHLQDQFRKILEEYHAADTSVKQKITSLHQPIDAPLLRQAERGGAYFTQAYVLTFSQLLVDEIRKLYKENLLHILPVLLKAIERGQTHQKTQLKKEIHALQQVEREWEQQNVRYDTLLQMLDQTLASLKEARLPLIVPESGSGPYIHDKENTELALTKQTIDLKKFYPSTKTNESLTSFSEATSNAQLSFQKALSILEETNGLDHIKQTLHNRLQRMQRKKYRVSLFGAFSAGKSSLANALLGEKFLPVAANPTTAAVQYITAPDEHHPNKTVVITYKSEADVLADMNDVVRPAGIKLETPDDWNRILKESEEKSKKKENKETTKEKNEEGKKEETNPLGLLHHTEIEQLNQLYAVLKTSKYKLGTEKQTHYEEYVRMTANEEKALLVKSVTIYFDCMFTREGYQLTDTPGIGSIYRRHSEIAFTEMKEADAVLFVSYYNHPFSKADKEFLLQLGRTKDYFPYDKIFFLVNAVDLANDEEEIHDVLTYVNEQLIHLGIHSARIYPIAGKLALENNVTDNKERMQTSGVPNFLHEFRDFSHRILQEMVIKEGESEIRQAISLLEDQRQSLLLEDTAKAKQQKIRKQELLHFKSSVKEFPIETIIDWVLRELEELLFYVKQRVFYRYYDEFKDIFSIVRLDEEMFVPQLHRCTNEMIHFIFYDLAQEIRASIIRIEFFIKKEWQAFQEEMLRELSSPLQFAFVKGTLSVFPPITVKEEMPLTSNDLGFLAEFKSHHDFFVGQQNKLCKEKLEEMLRPYGNEYVQKYHIELRQTYCIFIREEWEKTQNQYRRTVNKLLTENETNTKASEVPHLDSIIKKLKAIL
ncbi:dynamin family protein [Bacillus piscicola]|uniref:dynamin family protein n=1 Tax=Bacillus piscicola TaxID=1632684 RepID=UPI001F08B297